MDALLLSTVAGNQKLLGNSFSQFNSDIFVRVSEQDDQADNQCVNSQGLDHGETDHHGGEDFAGSAGITGYALHCALDGKTLTDAGAEGSESHADTGCQYTHCKKAHCSFSFLSWYDFLNSIGIEINN